jgi:hypothetical protein
MGLEKSKSVFAHPTPTKTQVLSNISAATAHQVQGGGWPVGSI